VNRLGTKADYGSTTFQRLQPTAPPDAVMI
jgi:hypothetical protein